MKPSEPNQDETFVRGPRKRLRNVREFLGTYGLVAIILAAAVWITYQFVEPAPPRSVTLLTGSADGDYHRYGKALQAFFAKENIDLQLVNTNGSVDNLSRLAEGEGVVAFVQSGLAEAVDYPQLQGLGSIYFEPLWLFNRGNDRIERLTELNGLRIAVGPVGSGTRQVATDLMQDNGLSESALTLLPLAGMPAADALLAGELDAVFTISGERTTLVNRLLNEPGIQLASFSRAKAYARRYPQFSSLELPEGVVNFATNIPAADTRLVASAATLVAHEDMHPALANLLLQAAADVFSEDTLFASGDRFPSPDYLDFSPSDEATRFYRSGVPFLQRYLPFWAANLVDRLKLLALPLVALLLPLMRIVPPTYRWTVRKKIYRWYDEVQDVDQQAHASDVEAELRGCIAELTRIENDAINVEVPLGYAHELYELRLHIDLLKDQIKRKSGTLQAQE